MKKVQLFASVAVLALLAWFFWPLAAVEPLPPGDGAARDPSTPAPAATDSPESRPAEAAPEHVRRPVDPPTGPTGARVTCVWANDGKPVAAMPVLVYRIEHRAYVGPVATAATDGVGIVTFTELTTGEHAFRAVRAEARATIETGVLVETKLTLKGSVVVCGSVVDAAKAPVEAAEVAAEIAGIPQLLATTGVDGRFRARMLSRAQIWARKEGHGPSRLHQVAGDTEDLVLQLEAAGGSLNGVVLDPDGRAVARATVAIAIDLGTDRNRPRQPPVLLETDDSGEFATTQVPRGTFTVYAHAQGFAFGQTDADTMSADRVVVRLRRAVSIHGVVLGGENRKPLVGKPLLVHRQRDLPGLLVGTSDRLTRSQAVTDSEGRYRMTGIPPGRMWVIVTVGSWHVHHNVLLREGEDHEWNPDLSRPAGVIRGVLQGPDGKPLAGWQVSANRIDLIEMKPELSRAKTGADGQFELLELRPFPQTLTVTAPDRRETVARRDEVQPGTPAFVWRLAGLPSQSGAIIGRVLRPDGKPVGDAKIRASSEGISRSGSPLSDSRGGFHIGRVLPGTWNVVGRLEGYGSFDLGRHWVTANANVDIGTHRLPPRGAAIVRLTGRGFEPAGIELALEQVEGGKNKTSKFTVDQGALRSPGLPPGRYRLLARGANFAPITRNVTLLPGSDVKVDLDAEPAAPVAIEFVPEDLASREWQDYLRFTLRNAGGEVVFTHRMSVRGAPTSKFTIGLTAGAYTIEGWSTTCAYRRGSTRFVVPSDTTGKRDVRVLLKVQKH